MSSIAGLELSTPDQNFQSWGICFGLYGKSGMGKTTVAGTIAKSKHAGRVLYIDREGGSQVLAGQNLPIDILFPKNHQETDRLNTELLKRPVQEHKTFIFDLVTEMQKNHLDSMSSASTREWKHYTRSQEWMEKFIRNWRDKSRAQGINVIFVFQEEKDQEEDTKRWINRLNMTPKLANDLPYLLDYIGYLTLLKEGSEERVLSFASSVKFATKTRRPLVGPGSDIPKTIFRPDLSVMLDVLRGDRKWPTEYNTAKTAVEKLPEEKQVAAQEESNG